MLTAVVLARDEEKNISRCLNSLSFCKDILVIDDNSRDNTASIARKMGAKVITHALTWDFAAQRNFALNKIPEGWVLFIDADEEVAPELAEEILKRYTSPIHQAYYINRYDFLWGKKMKHGDAKTKLIRLAKKGSGSWQGKIHERWVVDEQVGELNSPLYHYPHPTLVDFLHHINDYSSIRAEELHGEGSRSGVWDITIAPIMKFIHLYFLKLGFLDGIEGFISCMMMSFYTFLVRGKLFLLDKNISTHA